VIHGCKGRKAHLGAEGRGGGKKAVKFDQGKPPPYSMEGGKAFLPHRIGGELRKGSFAAGGGTRTISCVKGREGGEKVLNRLFTEKKSRGGG